MTKKLIWLVVLLAGSEAIGIVLAQWFFRVFKSTVPPAVTTEFLSGTAHAAFITTGLLAGLIICLWCLATLGVARVVALVGDKSRPAATAQSPK